MATDDIQIHLEFKKIPGLMALIRRIEHAGGDVKIPLKRWAVYMTAETIKTFDHAGRGSVKWKPLSRVALIMRAFRKRGSGRTNPKQAESGSTRATILQDSGQLKGNTRDRLMASSKNPGISIYNRTPYAEKHQQNKGPAFIKIPARTIRPVRAKALAFYVGSSRSGGGQLVFAKKVEQPARQHRIPRRPFLFVEPRDETRAVDILEQYERGVISKQGGI
jgi:phage gpG-like protein